MPIKLKLIFLFALLAACQAGRVSSPDGADGQGGEDAFADGADADGQNNADDGWQAGDETSLADGGDFSAEDASDGGPDGADDLPAQCGELLTFENGKTPASYLHVAVEGSDSSGDGSPERPFATISRAVRAAAPGVAVVVHAGTYAGGNWIENLRGTAEAPIWLGGATGEPRPVIEGGGEGLHLVKPRYVIVHDLEVRQAANNGINCDDGGEYADEDAARFVVFRDLDIHDIGGDGNQDCLKLSGLNDFWVLESHFARCGGNMSGSGIDHVGCHRGVIASCFFEQNSGNAVQCKGGSADLDIVRNAMIEPGERAVNLGGSTGFEFFRPPLSADQPNAEARRIRVQANVIVGGTAALAFVGCIDCLAAHNTIITPRRWLIRILQETTSQGEYVFEPCGNNAVVNNIFYFDRSVISTYVNIGSNTAPETFNFAGNLWYARDDPASSRPQLPVEETSGIYGQDPGFVDASQGDWHIGPSSPAANSGVNWPDLTATDRDGRCFGSPPSRGAYQAQ